MLTLTRRVGERIAIGNDVEIEVVAIQGGRVRVGIRAPKELRVYRGELVDKIRGENMNARAEGKAPALPEGLPIIDFPDGLVGMPAMTRWVVFDLAEEIPSVPNEDHFDVRLLVSVDDANYRLLILDLERFDGRYPVAEAATAAQFPGRAVAVGGVVTAPAQGETTVNRLAPIVVDLEQRVGRQVIMESDELPVQFPLNYAAAEQSAGW